LAFKSKTGLWRIHCDVCRREEYRAHFYHEEGDAIFHHLAQLHNTSWKRRHGVSPNITGDDIKAAYDQADGHCAFFRSKKVVFDPLSAWRLSVTRANHSLPLSGDNIAIICKEFQTHSTNPWTHEKFAMLRGNIGKEADLADFLVIGKEPKRTWLKNGKTPDVENSRDYIRDQLSGMRLRNRKHKVPFNITYEDLRLLVLTQKGLCSISGVPMVFKRGVKDFQASVERADPNKHYTLDNISFCCMEFNVMCNKDQDSTGPGRGAQWTREKFLEFVTGEGWSSMLKL
jgi:hypothetical protein